VKDIGPIVPIVTPCRRNGEIDLDGFRAVCNEMLQIGFRGIFVAGSTGRGPWFSLSDRVTLCQSAAEIIAGRVPLLAGCIASGLPAMLESAQAMAEAGAKIAIATAPGYFHYNQQELESIFLKFADSSPLPVIIYDIPEFTNLKLATGMVTRLARHGNILGFKDSSADFERFVLLIEALKEFPDFCLLQGKEQYLADSLRQGCSGFVVSLIHLAPASFMGLYRAIRSGDTELAYSLQAEVNRAYKLVRDSIERRPESSSLFHLLNYAMRTRGVCDNILLDHDSMPPAWLNETARQAVSAFETRVYFQPD
jgi:4-hydroxy-tetrahydrodipicolinate synthase